MPNSSVCLVVLMVVLLKLKERVPCERPSDRRCLTGTHKRKTPASRGMVKALDFSDDRRPGAQDRSSLIVRCEVQNCHLQSKLLAFFSRFAHLHEELVVHRPVQHITGCNGEVEGHPPAPASSLRAMKFARTLAARVAMDFATSGSVFVWSTMRLASRPSSM